MIPKGFSNFFKNPDMPKLACVVIAVFLAILILRYFKVIEGMAASMVGVETMGHRGGGGGQHSDKPPKKELNSAMDPTKLMEQLGL